MAKKKAPDRSPKNKERTDIDKFTTVGVRASKRWAKWLEDVAKHDRVTVAAFVEKAAIERAQRIGFGKEPPERIP
ncbi:MAG: hypothetical protein P4L84_11205 [Isosphaeraceae bacterium]|nr:hypothetical protein [Isosphaeraceae bacterium]